MLGVIDGALSVSGGARRAIDGARNAICRAQCETDGLWNAIDGALSVMSGADCVRCGARSAIDGIPSVMCGAQCEKDAFPNAIDGARRLAVGARRAIDGARTATRRGAVRHAARRVGPGPPSGSQGSRSDTRSMGYCWRALRYSASFRDLTTCKHSMNSTSNGATSIAPIFHELSR